MPLEDLNHYVRSYDDDLSGDFCRQLITSFNSLERFQRPNGRRARAGLEESAWTELNVTRMSDQPFLQMFRQIIDRALARYNADIALSIPIPNTPLISDLVIKRYRPGHEEQFQLHFDAVDFVANRYLVLMWYLNDVAMGGQTRFPQIGCEIVPKAGRLLIFPPYWMYQHEGAPPQSGDKYIISTYLLFEPLQPAAKPA